tara:strand:- start:132 stop:644 length:513 start_codon:yes stop_codon:yes gene_type:complete
MACTLTITGRAYPCKDKIGGIKRIWIKQFETTDWGTITEGEISAGVAITLFGFEITKNAGSFQQAVNASVENGTVFYSQVLEVSLPNLIAADNEKVANILKNRLTVIVQDVNDNYFAMGHTTGAEATGGTVGTGTAKGDFNGYQLQLTAEEAIPAPFVDIVNDITLTPGV